jgi:SAM-dependent methyltransferase
LIRTTLRRLLPGRVRAGLRRLVADAPFRCRDLFADLAERLRPGPELALPPAALRHRVGPNSSRAEFLHVGRLCADDLMKAYRKIGRDAKGDRRWLDFGCGCGRVARHLIGWSLAGEGGGPKLEDYSGVDVDPRQIEWAERHLAGRFSVIPHSPPTALDAGAFDVLFTISVFTHLDESTQDAWLKELRRLLRPGGLLLATTHSPEIARTSPGVTAGELARLAERGFLFRRSVGPFNEQSAFHSEAYLRKHWGAHFELQGFFPFALGSFQDISAWERA